MIELERARRAGARATWRAAWEQLSERASKIET
jgi:hypothetical protein